MIIIDTGPVVAMANRRDRDHQRCVDLLTTTVEPLISPEPLLTEIGYMLGSRAGARAEADFLRDVAEGLYSVESLLLNRHPACRGSGGEVRELAVGHS